MSRLPVGKCRSLDVPRRNIKDGDISPLRNAKPCFQKAKRSSNPILGRIEELRVLKEFLTQHLERKTPGSMYISGAPGTGKTACLMSVLDDCTRAQHKFTSVFINCMALTNSNSIYDKVIEGCGKAGSGPEVVKKLLTSKGQPVVVVLDEIDQLDSRNKTVLYSLFELPRLNNSRLILFGIANALDLTDRIVPHLQAYGCKPRLVHFSPYTQQEIEAILKDHECSAVVQPLALQFCARKVAACTGDVRKALDICRRAIEVVDTKEVPEHGSQPKVGVEHISALFSLCGDLSALPLQQKLLLCAILVTMKTRKLRDIPQGKLQEVYCRICKKHQVFVDQSDFQSLCTLLEAHGLIRIKKHKEVRLCKVTLCIDETQVEHVLEDKALLANCLADHTAF